MACFDHNELFRKKNIKLKMQTVLFVIWNVVNRGKSTMFQIAKTFDCGLYSFESKDVHYAITAALNSVF